MKRILLFLLMAANVHAATEAVTVDSKTRNVKNVEDVNFATGQLTVNNVSVVGGAGGGGGLSDIPTGKVLRVDVVNGNDASAIASNTGYDLSKPFRTIAAANTASAIGDVIEVGPGTHELASKLTLKANVGLNGAGTHATVIQSAQDLNTGTGHGPIIVPANNCVISNLTIQATGAAGIYQAEIGFGTLDAGATNVVVSNVRLIGDSDGIFFGNTDAVVSTMAVHNSVFETKYDAVALFQPAEIDMFNCNMVVTGPSSVDTGPAPARGCFSIILGAKVRWFNGSITVSGGETENVGASTASNGRIELYNTRLNVSGTAALDLQRAGGFIGISGVVRPDGGALVTSGTITNLSRNLTRDAAGTITLAPASNITVPGLTLADTTAASDGNQQHSPGLIFEGRGWKTSATATSRKVEFQAYALPIQGANTTGAFVIESRIAPASSFSHTFNFFSDGGLVIGGSGGGGTSHGDGSLGVSSVYFTDTVRDTYGTGTPEGLITAGIGSTYRRLDGSGTTALYVKGSGTGNMGWVAIGFDPTAIDTSGELQTILTDETGSGLSVFNTDPIILYPNAAQAANAIDVTKQNGTKTISADTTFTLSAAPANGSSFGLKLTNSDTAAHTITLPAGTWKSDSRQGATITTFSLPGSSTVTLSVDTEPSSTYRLFGEPLTAADLTAEPTPATTDYVVIHDVSSGKDKKALISDLPGTGGTSYVFNVETYGAVHNGVTNDRTAINAAIAACYTAGGGTVFFPNGHYIISGSTWDATTNSLLTIPTTPGYGDVQIVELVGQTRGTINGTTRAYISGVVLDASAATGASGVFPAVFAAAEFQEITDVTLDPDQWVSLGVRVRHLTIVVPGDSDFGGIQLHNCMQGRVEDCYVIGMTTSGFVAADNPEAVGIIYPAHLNNLHVKGSENSVLGFYDGIWAGEHQKFDGDNVAFCKNGVRFRHNAHMIKGDLMIERCERVLVVDAAATKLRFDLTLEAEVGDLGGDPYTPAGTFSGYYDVNGIGKGILRSSCLYLGVGYDVLSHSDVAGVRFEDINNIDQFGGGTSAPTDYIARYNFDGDLTDETATFDLTGVGSPTFSGGAVVLNGTTQYATQASLDLSSSNFTVLVEVEYSTAQNKYIACQMHTTAANNRWQMFVQTDDSVQGGVIATGGSPETTTGALAPDTRHFIAFTWNNATGVQRIRANNGAWVVEASSGTMNTTGTSADFSVGARQDGVAPIAGKIYEMRIFNRVLSDDEVTASKTDME